MPTLPQEGAPHELAEVDWAAALEADMLVVVRHAIEHIVNAARVGYRHGTKVRTVTSPVGAVTVTVPRARLQTPTAGRAEWESRVLPAYARRMRQVNVALLQVYLGHSRRIRGALRPLLHRRAVSRSAISRIVRGLKAQVAAWLTRSLAELDLVYLYLDGFHLRVRPGGRVSPVPVLAVLGVQRQGTARRRRTDLAGAAIQRCTVHKLRNLLTTAPRRLHDELCADYHAIVMAEDGAAAQRGATAFCRKWAKTCAGTVKSLQEAGAELLTMFRYPRSQWKSLRCTNGLERLNLEFRRRVKTQVTLPSEDAVLALLLGLVATGQIVLRELDGWQDMATALTSAAPKAEEAARIPMRPEWRSRSNPPRRYAISLFLQLSGRRPASIQAQPFLESLQASKHL
jgi:transposase-like protein